MKTSTTKVLRARAYIRVSHVGKARQDSLLSDVMQLDESRRYAEYLGFAFDEDSSKTHSDIDVSGFRKPWRQRPGLMAHYQAAERGEFDVLIFYKISRLARNVKEALDMISAFESLGVAFHFVAEKVDSTSGHGRFVRNVLLSAAEMQSEDTSEFLRAACERRAREGRLQGGATPAWICRSASGELDLIPEQVEAIGRMVDLRLSGMGYVRIAQALNAEGYRTVNGQYWTHGMTYKYLQPTWIKTMLGAGFFGRGATEPIEIPHAYPPILTQDEADRLLTVQRLYSEDYGRKPVGGLDWMVSKRRKIGRYSASSIHLLSSIVYCPHCGARMVASSRSDIEHRSTPFKYGCPHYMTRTELHRKGLNSVAAEALEDAVLRVLRGALAMPPRPIESKPRIARQAKSLDAIQTKIDRLVTMHLDGKLNDADFDRAYAELLDAREKQQEHDSVPRSAERQLRAQSLGSKSELSREELRQLVLLMIERVEAPITIAGHMVRSGSRHLRRFARIRLSFPRADDQIQFLAPIHTSQYQREREYWAELDSD